MPILDHTNNSIQQELRDASLMAFELKGNTFATGHVPSKGSQLNTGTYWRYDKAYFMSTQVAVRQPGTVPPVAKFAANTATFVIPSNHLGIAITVDEIVEASDEMAPLNEAAMFLGNNFVVKYELDWANEFVVDDVWAHQAEGKSTVVSIGGKEFILGDVTDPIATVGGGQFLQFNETASDPIMIFKDAIRYQHLDTGLRPNKLFIPRAVLDIISVNDQVIQHSSNTLGLNGGESQTLAILAQHLEIPVANIVIMDMVYQDIASIALANRAVQDHNFGQTSTPTFETDGLLSNGMKYVVEKSCLLMHNEGSFSKYARTAAAEFRHDGLMAGLSQNSGLTMAGGIDSPNLMIRSRYDDKNFTHYIEGYHAYKHEIIAPNLGFYLKDCIA